MWQKYGINKRWLERQKYEVRFRKFWTWAEKYLINDVLGNSHWCKFYDRCTVRGWYQMAIIHLVLLLIDSYLLIYSMFTNIYNKVLLFYPFYNHMILKNTCQLT